MRLHRTDPVSLVPGLVFLAIGVAAMVGGLTLSRNVSDWLIPLLLGAAGIGLLVSVPLGRPGAPDDDVATPPEVEPDPASPDEADTR